MTAPTYVGKGTFTTGIAAITPPLPTGLRNGDLLLLVFTSANEAITTPTQWTQVANSPQSTGTAATAGGIRIGVFWRIYNGNVAASQVADTGNLNAGQIFAFRGVDLQNPIDISAGSVNATATATITCPAVTTTVDNCMIVGCVGLDKDLADADTITGTWTNANLTGITERHDETVSTAAGGGLAVVTGLKATAGATGTTTNTADTSTTHAYVTVALKPMEQTVRAVGQYGSNESTVLAVGGSQAYGATDSVHLVGELNAGTGLSPNTPKSETEVVATSFDNTSNGTLRAIVQEMPADNAIAKRGSVMVYDPDNKRYVSFGGFDGTTRYNEVWVKYTDVPHGTWRKITVTGTPPTGKNLMGATLVRGNLTSGGALRSYMVIWGGANPSDTNEMHTIRLDTIGSEAWATITQTSAPSVRSYMNGHLTATPGTDSSNNYIYLFGGWAAARSNLLVRCTFDVDAPTAVTWTTMTADGAGGSPSARSGVVMDYKASTNKIYLFGGYNGTTMLSDFWEYDVTGNSWTNTSPTGTAPAGREVASGGYDSVNNRFWYTGGWTTNGTFSTSRNDIGYIADVGGSESYVEVRANVTGATSNQEYAGNSFAGFCIDTDRRLLVLRGMATVDSTERYCYAIDLNDGITSNKPVYGVSEGESLTPRDAAATIWNPDFNEWVVVGGFSGMYDNSTIAAGTHCSDVWVYDQITNTWRYANKGHKTLPPMEGRIGCYDTSRDRILLFGGLTGIDYNGNEVWTLTRDSMGNYEAAKLTPTGTPPQARWLGIIAYDATNDRMITGMGRDVDTLFNDMYSLSFSGGSQGAWTTLSPSGTPPTAASQPAYFNKVIGTTLYVFGGATNTSASAVSSQLLAFNYSTTSGVWSTPTSSAATARRGMAFGYDAANNRLVISHGQDGSASLSSTQWWNVAAGGAWVTPTIATTGHIPVARRSTVGMFISGKLYMFGGRPTSGVWFNDTVELTIDYATPNSTTWADKNPKVYTPLWFEKTGLAVGSYHWQAWSTE